MPKLKDQLPKYRLHKPSGQAIVTLSSRDFLLGKHGSVASRREYRRLTGEWLAGHGAVQPLIRDPQGDFTVAEFVLAFWRRGRLRTWRGAACPCGGLALGELGRREDAILAFREALVRDPGHAMANYNLADELDEAGCGQAAKAYGEAYLRRDPFSERTSHAKARLALIG